MKIDFTDLDYVKALQSDLRTDVGKRFVEFLDEACGYDQSIFEPTDRDLCLINDGKRQVAATCHTLLKLSPEDFVRLAKQKEG